MFRKGNVLKLLLFCCLAFCIGLAGVFCVAKKPCPFTNSTQSLSDSELYLDLQQRYAHNLEKTILSLLEPLVGTAKVRVATQVKLNLKSAQLSNETTATNLDAKDSLGKTISSTKTSEKQIQNLIQEQHISVVIDGNTRKGDKGIYQPRTPTEMETFRKLIASAIGYNPDRGDTLEVQNLPFESPASSKSLFPIFFYVLIGVILILFLLIIFISTSDSDDISKTLTLSDMTNVMEKINSNPLRLITVIKNWFYMPEGKNNNWTPVQKVGIALLALDEEIVRQVLLALEDDEIRRLAKTMANLGVIPPRESLRVLNELATAIEQGSAVVGNSERVRQILDESIPNQPKPWKTDVKEGVNTIWQELVNAKSERLISRLSTLRPELIAYILYRLPSPKASELVTKLPQTVATQTLIHLNHMGYITSSTQLKLEQEVIPVVRDILDTLNIKTGAEKASEILNELTNTNQNQDLLDHLSQSAPDLTQQILCKLMKFDDFANWPNETIQIILRHTPRNVALTALINASPAVLGAVSRNIPPQMWGQLTKEMDDKKQTPQEEIENARKKILQIVQELIHQNKIKL